MKTLTIRFTTQVDKKSVDTLMRILDEESPNYEEIVLLISSQGGTITDGLTAYHYIRNLPLEVTTYNIGSVDSIAVVLFCAGNTRYAVPQASFLIHSVTFTPDKEEYEEKKVREELRNLEDQRKNIASVIAVATNKSQKEIEDMMMEGITLNSQEAKDFGLIDEIMEEFLTTESKFLSID